MIQEWLRSFEDRWKAEKKDSMVSNHVLLKKSMVSNHVLLKKKILWFRIMFSLRKKHLKKTNSDMALLKRVDSLRCRFPLVMMMMMMMTTATTTATMMMT